MAIHETDLGKNRHGLSAYNHITDLGYSQATAAPANYAAMRAAMLALPGLQENQSRILAQQIQNLDVCNQLGILTDTNCNVANSATDAAVRAIFTTIDPTLPANFRATFAFRA